MIWLPANETHVCSSSHLWKRLAKAWLFSICEVDHIVNNLSPTQVEANSTGQLSDPWRTLLNHSSPSTVLKLTCMMLTETEHEGGLCSSLSIQKCTSRVAKPTKFQILRVKEGTCGGYQILCSNFSRPGKLYRITKRFEYNILCRFVEKKTRWKCFTQPLWVHPLKTWSQCEVHTFMHVPTLLVQKQ